MANALPLITQLYIDSAWTTYPAYAAGGWSSRIGPDLESGLQPNRLDFVLSNDDLAMDPTNAASPLYGKIGRNTRARIQINSTTLTFAEASSWRPERSTEHQPGIGRGKSSMAVTAEGLLRRLGRWEDPLDSPLRRQISSYTSLIGYWPLEDPSGAANFAQMVPGLAAGGYTGTVNLAGDEGAGGSLPNPTIGSGARIGAQFLTQTASGWQFSIACKLKTVPASATYQVLFTVTDTVGRAWNWLVNDNTFQIQVLNPDGSVLDTSLGVNRFISATEWFRCRLKVTVSGGTVTYEPAWYAQDDVAPFGITDTFAAASTGVPRTWFVIGNPYTTDAAYGHAFAVTDTSLDLVGVGGAARDAFNAYLGERAGYRFVRLMTELGLQPYVSDAALTAPMGRQKPAKIIDLLEEIVRTDAALIYDEPSDIALTMRVNRNLLNRAVALTLTYGTEIAPPLRKLIDDVGVVNEVVTTNWDGSEVRRERTTGSLSTAVPPAGVGRYRKTLEVSLANTADLASRGNWDLANGTLDRPRYQQVTFNLSSFPALRTAVHALRPGDIIKLLAVEPDPVYLRVMTIEHQGGAVLDTVVLSCLPADVWLSGKWSDGVSRRDSRSTTVKTAVNSSATSITFRTAVYQDRWSSTSTPYDVLIAGERLTVTAMAAAALVSGAYDQVATVTRSTNGVVKAQAAGAEIHIATPGRWVLGGI